MSHALAVDRAFAVIAFKRRLAYKSSWLFGLALGGGSMLVSLTMWHNLIGDGTLAGYDWDSMRAYSIIGFVAATMVFGAADFQIAERILDGHIAIDLTKPVDFQRARAAGVHGIDAVHACRPQRSASSGPRCCSIRRDRPRPWPGCSRAVSFVLLFPLAFGITYLSVLVCFWTKRYLGVLWLREALLSFFSGLMIPLAFMPEWLQAVAWALPFPHFTTTPSAIYLGRVDTAGALGLLAAEAAWVLGCGSGADSSSASRSGK